MVRNFIIVKAVPPRPGRSWRNRIGRPCVARTASAVQARTGERSMSAKVAPARSIPRLATRERRGRVVVGLVIGTLGGAVTGRLKEMAVGAAIGLSRKLRHAAMGEFIAEF